MEKVKDEKNLGVDMVRFEKGLEARPKCPWVVVPGRSSHYISRTTGQELQAA
jgi:hypothetical protein